jgi:hypothetical protein
MLQQLLKMPVLCAQVVKAVSRQLATLNTNARYLNQELATYTRDLAATFPHTLEARDALTIITF